MKLFECQYCGQLLHFENTRCERCGHVLGYLPDRSALSALTPQGGDLWQPLAALGERYRFCLNNAYDSCNWLVPESSPEVFCLSCRTNRTIPDLGQIEYRLPFQRLQIAKHRLFHGLLRFGLPVRNKMDDPDGGLAFDFLADPDPTFRESQRVMTGHAQGVVTINIAEADDAERERQRKEMAEPYRTILGHFRHEVGHYYWEKFVRDGPLLDSFRQLFGDESRDYGASLESYYSSGPPSDWPQHFVSAYASAHPWEDWAESWAHYLHMVDALETAYAYGLSLSPMAGHDQALVMSVIFDAYNQPDFDTLVGAWLPLTYAVNSLNRSVGQPDLYPFVLTSAVLKKLRFIHDLIRTVRA
ncbi:MAG TPA: putative zinc-binding peptidase [Alphaproteobacteria bacterium]|jgi:hypothetical protein